MQRAELEERAAALKAKLTASDQKRKDQQLNDEAVLCCIEFLSTYKYVMAVSCRWEYLANALVAIRVSHVLDGVFPIDCLGVNRPAEILDIRLKRLMSRLTHPVDPTVVCWYKAQLFFSILSATPDAVGFLGFSISDILVKVFPKHICGLRYAALQRQVLETLIVAPPLVAIRVVPHMFRDANLVRTRGMSSDDLGFSVREVISTLIDIVESTLMDLLR